MSNARDIIDSLGGTFGRDRGGDDSVIGLLKKTMVVTTHAFEADDDTQRQILFKNTTGHDLRLVAAEITLEATATEHADNFSVATVYHTDTPVSGTDKDPAVYSTDSDEDGTLTANTPGVMNLSATQADLVLADGEYAVLLYVGTAGDGVDLATGTIMLDYEFV
jgi:hypothetical protein